MCGNVASNFEVGWRAPTTGTVIMGATRAQQYSTGELLPPDAPPWCADSMPVRAWRWCGACNPLLVLTHAHALPGALLLLLYCCIVVIVVIVVCCFPGTFSTEKTITSDGGGPGGDVCPGETAYPTPSPIAGPPPATGTYDANLCTDTAVWGIFDTDR